MNDHKSRVERDGNRAKKSEIISTGMVSTEPRVSSATAAGYVDDTATIAGVSFASVLAMQNADDVKLIDEKDSDVCVIFLTLCIIFYLLKRISNTWKYDAAHLLHKFFKKRKEKKVVIIIIYLQKLLYSSVTFLRY